MKRRRKQKKRTIENRSNTHERKKSQGNDSSDA